MLHATVCTYMECYIKFHAYVYSGHMANTIYVHESIRIYYMLYEMLMCPFHAHSDHVIFD